MTLYERLEELRKNKEISQGKLEKELGFSNGSYSKIKNSMPNNERLTKLANYFNVSVEYLTTGKEPEIPTFDVAHLELIEGYSKLNQEQKDFVIQLIKTFNKGE